MSCHGTCERCAVPQAADGADSSPWSGLVLVWAATAVFLLPLATAVLGAALGGKGPTRQTAGAVLGFAVGVALAVPIVKSLRRRFSKQR